MGCIDVGNEILAVQYRYRLGNVGMGCINIG